MPPMNWVELESLTKAEFFYLSHRISHSATNFCKLMPVVTSLIGMESSGENSIFANKRNWGEIFGTPFYQRWSPRGRSRGHILKSLALASKPQVLKNCPALGSRTALFFEPLKVSWKTPKTSRKICKDLFCFPQVKIARKNFFIDLFRLKKNFKDFFFRTLASVSLGLGLERVFPWSWPREGLSLALASEFFCIFGLGLGLRPYVLDSTSALYYLK